MDKTTRHSTSYLTTKEIQRMTSDDIIKHVYIVHKSTKTSVENVWQNMFDNFGKQTINNMLDGGDDSINNDNNTGDDSRFIQVFVVYLCVFGLIYGIFISSVKNDYDALQFIYFTSAIASIFITLIFINIAGKNEKNYLNAINKLRKAHSVYTNRGGFKNLSGKPLDYAKEDS